MNGARLFAMTRTGDQLNNELLGVDPYAPPMLAKTRSCQIAGLRRLWRTSHKPVKSLRAAGQGEIV